ncbi:hypothetical protein HaLaN_27412 [Haematococcus lacustris]|uniref:Uncharacterized protein n=1 Tax=Haematococcus lacustris TaxID=44745 RepID=A0A6A0A8E2_HAELA|nr:hypothetical protein HaLaN_27412 [Haematococcus lacustris]
MQLSAQGGPVFSVQYFRSGFNAAGPGYRLGANQVPVLDTSLPHLPGAVKERSRDDRLLLSSQAHSQRGS